MSLPSTFTSQKWPISRRNGLLRSRKGRAREGICASEYGLNLMRVSFAAALDDGRRTIAIGRIRATGPWRAAGGAGAEADRQAAIEALTREAEDYGAEGVVDVQFDVEGCKG